MSGTEVAYAATGVCFRLFTKVTAAQRFPEHRQVGSAIGLRACYAMSGTDMASCTEWSGTALAVVLRACCAVSGTDIATVLRACYEKSVVIFVSWMTKSFIAIFVSRQFTWAAFTPLTHHVATRHLGGNG
eukprot:2303034-Rhodomonas_salina.1